MRQARKFVGDESGAIAVLGGIVLSAVLGFGAFGVDIGRSFADRRKAQSATDLAAIAAASDIALADQAARATIARNNLSGGTLGPVVTGIYRADPSLAPSQRFTPSSPAQANAVQVSVNSTTPLFLGRLLTGRDHLDIRTRATAAQTAFASFAIGSGLAEINGGLLNALLDGLLGTNLSLSAMDYQALLDTKIDLFRFSDALAGRIGVTAGTYDSLFSADVRIGDVFTAMADTARETPGATAAVQALDTLALSVQSSPVRIPLDALASLGPYGHLGIGDAPQVDFSLGLLDLVSATAQAANGGNQVAIGLDAGLPGIVGATLRLAIGERPQGRSGVAFGGIGVSAHTAQTRLLLDVTLAGVGSIASVRLPIYLEIAAASATLESIACTRPDISGSTVTLSVKPAVLDAWIGDVTPAMMTNFDSAPNPGAATLVSIPLLQVTGRAHAQIANLEPRSVVFSHSDIKNRTRKTVSTSDLTSSLLSSLIEDLDLDVRLLSFGLGLPGGLQSTVAGIIAGATKPLDALLANVLAGLGIRLGQAHVWTTGIRCDGAVLVN